MTTLDPRGYVAVSPRQFAWFIKQLSPKPEDCTNGTGYRDHKGTIVAMKTNGRFFVKTGS